MKGHEQDDESALDVTLRCRIETDLRDRLKKIAKRRRMRGVSQLVREVLWEKASADEASVVSRAEISAQGGGK